MTTTPGATPQMARMVSRLTAVPVGLFGLVMSTTSGRALTAAAAASGSMVKSSRRGNRTPFAVRVPGVLGVHRICRREGQHSAPGPANASSTWSITSLLPLAAQICSALNPLPR